MSVLSEFLVVSDVELSNLIKAGFEFDPARADFSWGNLDSYCIAELEAVLRGTSVEVIESERGDVFRDWIWFDSEADGPWVTELREPLVKALAELGEVGTRNVAREWAYKFDYPDDEAIELVAGLANVARKAVQRKARLVLWVCL